MIILLFSSIIIVSAFSMSPRTVNLDLETSFLFDSTDRRYLPFVSNLKSVVDTLYQALSPKYYFRTQDEIERAIFSKFLKKLGHILLKYDDEGIKNLVETFHEEIEEYYDKMKTVYDPMIFNPKFRMFVKNTIQGWMSTDPSILREKFKDFASNINSYVIIKYIDNLFKADDEATLKSFLNNFDHYLETQNVFKLANSVKETVKCMFDKYERLNEKDKKKLQNAVFRMFKDHKADDEQEEVPEELLNNFLKMSQGEDNNEKHDYNKINQETSGKTFANRKLSKQEVSKAETNSVFY